MSNLLFAKYRMGLKAKGPLSNIVFARQLGLHLKGLSLINKEGIDLALHRCVGVERVGYITCRQGCDNKDKMTAMEYIINEQR